MKDERAVLAHSLFILHPSSFILFQNFPVKINQLHRRGGRFKALVPQLDAGAVDCLVNRVCSYNSENYRHSCLQTCFADPASNFTGDVFEMRSLAANNRTKANDRIKLFRFGQPQSQQWDLKSAGDAVDLDQFFVRAQALERVERALNQTRADEVVPTTGDNRKTKSLTVKMSFVNYWLQERFGSLSCRLLRLAESFRSIGDAFLSGKFAVV